MKHRKNQIVLNENAIEKLNEFSYDISTLKQSFNLLLHCLHEDVYIESPVEQISLCHVVSNYIETLKSNFTEFLQEQNILL